MLTHRTGRHFSSAEILTFIASFIMLADVTIIPGGDTLKPDVHRIGVGVLQPKGSMRVRLRKRAVA